MAITSDSPKERGIQMFREGKAAESVDLLLQAVVEDPEDLDLYLYLGAAYTKAGNNDKAVEILQQASELAPDNPKIHYNLGVAYFRAKNVTMAKEEFFSAVNLDPDYEVAKEALQKLVPFPKAEE